MTATPRKRMCIRCHRARSIDGFHCLKCHASNMRRRDRAIRRVRQQVTWMDHDAMQSLIDELDRTMERPESADNRATERGETREGTDA